MRLLFVMRHSGYVRNFESTLRLLCEGGHDVHVAFEGKVKYEQLDPTDIAQQLATQYQRFTFGAIPPRRDGWGLVGHELRLGLDYLRYLERPYDAAPKLRERAERSAPPEVVEHARGLGATAEGRRLWAAWMRAANRSLPSDSAIDAYLREQRPDIVAVTPLIEPGSPQSEYLRSARALGIRTAYCVASWDNLTNKGLIHGPVDLVTVWNDAMRQEAVAMHGVPADRVVVTGAAAFDHWFEAPPLASREAFCARVGLPPDRPFLLYVCSSKFVAPEETPFVRRWLERLRASSGELRRAGVLIRPHPQNAEQWAGVDLSTLGPVTVWPRAGAAPVDAASRADYAESIGHSAGVVGINTTAEIESAILGRRVYTVLDPAFADTQEGTLHFHHLRRVNGGLLNVARDLDEHLDQLQAAVSVTTWGTPSGGSRRGADDSQSRPFVQAFVRPFGLDVPAAPKMVEALERLASMPAPRPEVEPAWAEVVRRHLEDRKAVLERAAAATTEVSEKRQAAKLAREERRKAREASRAEALARKVRKERERRANGGGAGSAKPRTPQSLVVDFASFDDADRAKVLRGITDAIPTDALVDLFASAPVHTLDYPHAAIRMRVTSRSEMFRLRAVAKEPFTVDWIHAHIGAGDVLYDIGANVGAYSLIAAMQPGAGARVFAFEPSYASVTALCANVRLNGLDGQVSPMPVALSDRTTLSIFSLRDVEPGAARHALGPDDPDDGPATFRQPVLTFRLDELIERFGLPSPHHIKLDVDGGELAVLDGASATLGCTSLRSVLVEVSTALSGAVTARLAAGGLALHEKMAVKNKAGDYAVWYGLFVR